MRTIDVQDARENLDALLQEVAEGGQVVITRAGEPVAILQSPNVPVPDASQLEATVDRLLHLRKGRTLGPGVSIRDIIEEGRRY